MRYMLLLLCCVLTACSVHENRDEEAGKILKSWTGRPIGIALGTLGPPTKTIQKSQNKIYLWTTERSENIRIIGGREVVRDGPTGAADADHFNIKASCGIIIVTSLDDVILGYRMQGQILTCSQFADTLLASKAKLPAQ